MKKMKNILLGTILLLLYSCTFIANDIANTLYKKTHPHATFNRDKIRIERTEKQCNKVREWCVPHNFNEYGTEEGVNYYCVCFY